MASLFRLAKPINKWQAGLLLRFRNEFAFTAHLRERFQRLLVEEWAHLFVISGLSAVPWAMQCLRGHSKSDLLC